MAAHRARPGAQRETGLRGDHRYHVAPAGDPTSGCRLLPWPPETKMRPETSMASAQTLAPVSILQSTVPVVVFHRLIIRSSDPLASRKLVVAMA